MDTVWIRLTEIIENGSKKECDTHFMFGPTGIVRFTTEGDRTGLVNSNKVVVAVVKESDEYIMNILRKVRKTEGILDAKQKRNAKRKAKTSNPKAKK